MSEIIISPTSTTYSGPDAVEFFRVHSLRSSILLYHKTKLIPTRGLGITKMLSLASAITGQKYKRSETLRAADDLHIWLCNMRSALPTTYNRQG